MKYTGIQEKIIKRLILGWASYSDIIISTLPHNSSPRALKKMQAKSEFIEYQGNVYRWVERVVNNKGVKQFMLVAEDD